MPTIVKAVVATKKEKFSGDTIPVDYLYTLQNVDRNVVEVKTSPNPVIEFTIYVPGNYSIIVMRHGFQAEVGFNVPDNRIELDVPNSISVTLG